VRIHSHDVDAIHATRRSRFSQTASHSIWQPASDHRGLRPAEYGLLQTVGVSAQNAVFEAAGSLRSQIGPRATASDHARSNKANMKPVGRADRRRLELRFHKQRTAPRILYRLSIMKAASSPVNVVIFTPSTGLPFLPCKPVKLAFR
jgi:hypothetical protein